MTHAAPRQPRRVLLGELHWFVQLRWLAGAAVVAGSLADHQWLGLTDRPLSLAAVGAAILLYNVALAFLIRPDADRVATSPFKLRILAATQVFLDLVALTLICLWTGGASSPFIAFFVFHMVFASLLLPSRMAYAVAAMAALLLGGGLVLTTRWPTDTEPLLRLAVFFFMMLFTVHLANHMTRALRRQRRILLRRNRRIHRMSRTLRKHQQAMIQHEKMVALGHMAAGLTHEITNPLASMDSLLQLMQRMPDRMNEASALTLREQVGRVHRIVQQMKTFARPADMQNQSMPLNEIVQNGLAMLRYDSRLKRIKVETDLSPDSPVVMVFPQAMEQVLVNLIQNAIDAMAETPEPRLILRTRTSGSEASIEVIDNGHGIAPTQLSRVFEPFFTTIPPGKGTGLGLSISYSLLQKQNGSIEAHNAPGGGARFVIRLRQAGQAATDASRNREPAGTAVSISENSNRQ